MIYRSGGSPPSDPPAELGGAGPPRRLEQLDRLPSIKMSHQRTLRLHLFSCVARRVSLLAVCVCVCVCVCVESVGGISLIVQYYFCMCICVCEFGLSCEETN